MLEDPAYIHVQNLDLDRCRTQELLETVRVRKPSLVLDLDDTLICSFPLPPKSDNFPVQIKKRKLFIAVRPGLRQFLEQISQVYEIFIYTYAEKEYADKVLNIIAPEIDNDHRLYREHCVKFHGYSVKDLRNLHRPLNRVILVDDTMSSGLLQPPNIIQIKPYSGEVDDKVLLEELLPILQHSAQYQNTAEAAYEKVSSHIYPSLFAARPC